MEFLLASGLAGLGYYLNDNNQPVTNKKNKYVQRPEHTRNINQRSRPSRDIVRPIVQKEDDIIISKLTGLPIKKDNFTHNNMVPFFGGSIKQNLDFNANNSLLESHTGVIFNKIPKVEQKPFFEPKKEMSYIHGTPNITEQSKNRYISSKFKPDMQPTKSVIVGPGLNKGYTSRPSGGFQQPDTRDYALPKTVDELRVLTNPKMQYKGRIIKGKNKIDKRSKQEKIFKRRPDRFYKNSPKRYNTTVGAYTKEKVRSKTIVKDTNRKNTREVMGAAGPTRGSKKGNRACVRPSDKVVYESDGFRNLVANDKWKNSEVNDYGKKTIKIDMNNRNITSEQTHITNLTSFVKAIITPVQDVFKETKKEEIIENNREGNIKGDLKKSKLYLNDKAKKTIKETNIHNKHIGYMSSQKPSSHTVFDPSIGLKTTIKETTIHNKRKANIKGPICLQVYDPLDVSKRTIKETLVDKKINKNISLSVKKHTIYDPDDKPGTTIKETNIRNTHKGNIDNTIKKNIVYDPNDKPGATIKETHIHNNYTPVLDRLGRKSTVYDPNDIPGTTIKETNIHNSYTGGLNGLKIKPTVYDPTDIPGTTIKETGIHNNHTGGLSGLQTKSTIYDPNDIPGTTLKETNIHNQYTGGLDGVKKKSIVYDPNDKPETTMKDTNIHNKYIGTISALKHKSVVYDPSDIPSTTIKETQIHNNHTGGLDGLRLKSTIYDPNDIPSTTMKETQIHNNHTGGLSGLQSKATVYDPQDIPNTTIKETGIHNNYTGGLTGLQRKSTVYDPNDIPGTTIKETHIYNKHEGNLATNINKNRVYDPEDKPCTTLKETNIHNKFTGLINHNIQKSTVYDPDDFLRTTQKETYIDNKRKGMMSTNNTKHIVYDPNDLPKRTIKETGLQAARDGNLEGFVKKSVVYDPDDKAKTTLKETQIEQCHDGYMNGLVTKPKVYDRDERLPTTMKETNIYDSNGGYVDTGHHKIKQRDPNLRVKNTIRQTLDNFDTEINISYQNKGKVYDPDDIPDMTIRDSTADNSHTGQVQNTQHNDGYKITKMEADVTNRELQLTEYSGNPDGQTGVGDGTGYQVEHCNTEAPLTLKQFTSDNDYTGNAEGIKQPISYENIRNATLNEVRQDLLKEREPTRTGNKKCISKSEINMEVKRQMMEDFNQRKLVQTRVIDDNYRERNLQQDITKNKYEECDRNNPELLKAFKDNPYTKSLNSSY